MSLNPRVTNWAGRTVWLVGASTGIGRATAHLLHARGAAVAVSARQAPALNDFVAHHPGSLALPLDVTDSAGLAEAARQLMAWSPHGRLDMVVYCAGHYQPMRAQDFDLKVALQHLQVNQEGALRLLDVVLPVLKRQQGGHLSLVASVAGYRGLPKALAYGPTKAALQNLAEVLYLDLQSDGIGVSVVNPGFVETPMTAGNDFTMPALITAAQAAEAMLAGWEAGLFEVHFPKRFTLWLKCMRLLPAGWYFPVVRRVTGG
jgi:NAD(P)-dependent dehydrogenase (short-subunit alcohol dehydrogenase family)